MSSSGSSHFGASQRPPSSGIARWRLFLRVAGVFIALAVSVYWGLSGANTGFYKDSVEIKKTDEITGIDYVEYEDRFIPGIEFLIAGTGLGLVLIAVTFFPSRKPKHTS
jgi:hypothetical protein